MFAFCTIPDPKSREVVLNACKAVGSISNTSFDIRFNPDLFSPGAYLPDPLISVFTQEALTPLAWPALGLTLWCFARCPVPRGEHRRHPETEAAPQRRRCLRGVLPGSLAGMGNLSLLHTYTQTDAWEEVVVSLGIYHFETFCYIELSIVRAIHLFTFQHKDSFHCRIVRRNE